MRSFVHSVPPLAALLLAGSCASLGLGMSQKDGLERVDELLTHVERVHVESAVAKDRALGAFESLRRLVAPEFKGDPAAAHAELVAAIGQSEHEAEALQNRMKPLRRTAESVFARWTANLESIGNVAVRQKSQERLEETRRRYEAVVAAAVAAQLACDTFNHDLADHALFLENDFNSASVGLVAQELEGLRTRGKELGRRLDACGAACQAYVEYSAPKSQVAPPGSEAKPAPKTPPAKKPTAESDESRMPQG